MAPWCGPIRASPSGSDAVPGGGPAAAERNSACQGSGAAWARMCCQRGSRVSTALPSPGLCEGANPQSSCTCAPLPTSTPAGVPMLSTTYRKGSSPSAGPSATHAHASSAPSRGAQEHSGPSGCAHHGVCVWGGGGWRSPGPGLPGAGEQRGGFWAHFCPPTQGAEIRAAFSPACSCGLLCPMSRSSAGLGMGVPQAAVSLVCRL